MKNLFKFALGAIALFGMIGFTGCSSNDEVLDAVPGQSQDTDVSVNLVLSVSTGNEATTRQTAADVQATFDNTFRGIEKAELLAYKLGTTNDGKHVATATEASKVFSLGTLMTAGYINNEGKTNQEESRRVVEISLPSETNALMFWGKAIKDGTDQKEGSITFQVAKNISNNSFALQSRIPAGDSRTNFGQYQKMIALILTRIVQNGFNGSSTDKVNTNTLTVSYAGETFDSELNWSDYVDVTGSTMTVKAKSPVKPANDITPLEEILADAYIVFNTIYPSEIRAGSGPAVARMIGDLRSVISHVSNATPTCLEEAAAKSMAARIITRLDNYFEGTGTASKWKDDAKSNLKNHLNATAQASFDTDYAGVDASKLQEFPTNFNVPFGATQLTFDVANRTYSYVTDLPMSGMGGTTTSVYNYMYPAELCYFGNSPIRVTDDAHTTNDYPNGVANWDNDNSWIAGATGTSSKAWTKNSHVVSTTRSVAMQENINYGTALLKSTVRYGAATLKDNNAVIQLARTGATEADNSITVGAGSFTLTGIVVGGQEAEMGWNYVAKAESPKFDYMIYDNNIASTAIPAYTAEGAKSSPNYTLVWDNWNKSSKGSKQNDVYIALEFVNNTGMDFWGMNNLIRNGGTFYIIGKLDPDAITVEGKTAAEITADKSLGISWPTTTAPYALPPYESDGSTIKERRVFIQDYMTIANFVIGETSLQKAYVTVPDLRSTQISLGLSVDVNWSTGLTFDVTL